MKFKQETTAVPIGKAEALVLFEMLSDFDNQSSIQPIGAAERLALLRLHGALERTLVEPFMPNYKELVNEAKLLLVDE